MESVAPRYVVNEHQTPTDVVLTIDEWRRIVADLEELDDIRACDEARASGEESVSLAQVAHELRAGRQP
jgi:hypothetical protein